MLILIGKMGSGKDTIKNELIKLGMKNCCTYTTRPKRLGELDGRTYHFITDKEFETKKKDKFFVSTSTYHTAFGTWKYGTQVSELLKTSNSIVILNPTEIKQIKENTLLDELMNKNTKICYLIASGKSIWKRLSKRGDDPDEVKRRMERDQEDFKNISEYVDFSIRNEDINPKSLAKIIYGIYQQLQRRGDDKKVVISSGELVRELRRMEDTFILVEAGGREYIIDSIAHRPVNQDSFGTKLVLKCHESNAGEIKR